MAILTRLCAALGVVVVLLLPGLVSFERAPVAPAAGGPSVVLITVDTLRAGTPLPERTVFTDIGAEVSAYSQSGFLRIRGVAAAWQQRADALGALAPTATRYAWNGGSAWYAIGEQAVFPPDVDRYLRSAVAMRVAPDPSEGDILRLQALGYLGQARL